MNKMFDFGREGFLDGQISWSANTIRAVLVDTTLYTANFATNQWLSDIPVEARVSTSAPLSAKTITAGVASAAAATFTGVTGQPCVVIVLYRDSGVPSTSRLIAYLDQAVGLPVTPNGGDIEIDWDTGSNKIFKL